MVEKLMLKFEKVILSTKRRYCYLNFSDDEFNSLVVKELEDNYNEYVSGKYGIKKFYTNERR